MATSEGSGRRARPVESERPWYLRLGWVMALVLVALIAGVVIGFVWATTRDYAILQANGREITHLTEEVGRLRHQLQLAQLDKPQGNWWFWWLKAPFVRLFTLLHL